MSRLCAPVLALLMALSLVTVGAGTASSATSEASSAGPSVRADAARAPGDPIGQRCTRFREARRCAYWTEPRDPAAPHTLSASLSIWVFDGDHAEVRFVLFQRLTKNGWVTTARSHGSGVRTYDAFDSVPWRTCANLPRGTYRSRGKVRWTSEGVRYTRWITGTRVSKRVLCA